MRTTLTLNQSGMKRLGDLSVSYTPPGGDRPGDPATFTVSVEAETVKLPSPDPLDEQAHAANSERTKVAALNVKAPRK